MNTLHWGMICNYQLSIFRKIWIWQSRAFHGPLNLLKHPINLKMNPIKDKSQIPQSLLFYIAYWFVMQYTGQDNCWIQDRTIWVILINGTFNLKTIIFRGLVWCFHINKKFRIGVHYSKSRVWVHSDLCFKNESINKTINENSWFF